MVTSVTHTDWDQFDGLKRELREAFANARYPWCFTGVVARLERMSTAEAVRLIEDHDERFAREHGIEVCADEHAVQRTDLRASGA